jgi:hypothetical protein
VCYDTLRFLNANPILAAEMVDIIEVICTHTMRNNVSLNYGPSKLGVYTIY